MYVFKEKVSQMLLFSWKVFFKLVNVNHYYIFVENVKVMILMTKNDTTYVYTCNDNNVN